MSDVALHQSPGREVIAALSQRAVVPSDELFDRIEPLSDDEASLVLDHCIEPHELGGVTVGFYLVALAVGVGLAVVAGTDRIDEGAVAALLTVAPTMLFGVRRDVRRVLNANPARADQILVVGDDDDDDEQPGLLPDIALAALVFGIIGGLLAVLDGNVWLAFFVVVGLFVGRDAAGFALRAIAARRDIGPLAKPMFDVDRDPYLTYDGDVQRAVEAFGR